MELRHTDEYRITDITIYPSNVHPFVPTVYENGRTQSNHAFFIYVYEGELLYSIFGKTYIVGPHQMALFPQDVPFFLYTTVSKQFRATEGSLTSRFNKDMRFFDYFKLTTDDYVLTIDHYERMERCLEHLLHDQDFTDGISYQLNRVARMAEIMAIYFENLQTRTKNLALWEDVLRYMRDNLGNNLSIEALAELVHLHPNYFIKKFTKTFHTSPIKHYNALRVEKAIQLLADTDLPTMEVAAAIGITDANYFSYFFKASCGLSPRKFKELTRLMHGKSEKEL